MNCLHKFYQFYKKEGMLRTLTKTGEKCWKMAVRLPNRLREKLFLKRYISEIQRKAQQKHLIVLIPCIDWNIPLFQRPHQIAMELSKRTDTHVLFVSDEYTYDNFSGIRMINDHLDLLSWRIVSGLRSAFEKAKDVTVFMSWPRQARLLNNIPFDRLVYEYIDDLSVSSESSKEMLDKHYELMEKADLTVCTAKALYQDALPRAKKVILSPNAGDYTLFHSMRACEPDRALSERTKSYSCVLGYYGCLADWFDYDLVLEVARRKTDWCFVLVGHCYDGTVSRITQAGLNNILVYPPQQYEMLPRFISAFDIQLIPFVINEITKATSPVKVFEYMAAGKPILTSHLPELEQYQSVIKYADADEFIDKAQKLCALPASDPYFTVMNQEALNNTWHERVEEIMNTLENCIELVKQ